MQTPDLTVTPGQRIKDKRAKPLRSRIIYKDLRFIAGLGAGSAATNQLGMLPKLSTEMGLSRNISYVAAFDNNLHVVETAARLCARYQPSFFWRLRHPFKHDWYGAFNVWLPSVEDTVTGFSRDPVANLESLPVYYPAIMEGLAQARWRDLVNGNRSSFIYEPEGFGGHQGAPQACMRAQAKVQGLLRGTRVKVLDIPSATDFGAMQVFRNVFPARLDAGFDSSAVVLKDARKAYGYRTVAEQDRLVLTGILGTVSACLHDPNQPGPNDLWKFLRDESEGFAIVPSAFEDNLVVYHMLDEFGRKRADREVAAVTIRKAIQRVLNDANTRLVDAELAKDAYTLVVVVAGVKEEIYRRAIATTLLPKNVQTIFAPTTARKVTVVAFTPAKASIPSIERIFKIDKAHRNSPYKLPESITKKSCEYMKPIIKTTAEFTGLDEDLLL